MRYNDSDSCLQPPKRGYENCIYRALPMSKTSAQKRKVNVHLQLAKAIMLCREAGIRLTVEPLSEAPSQSASVTPLEEWLEKKQGGASR